MDDNKPVSDKDAIKVAKKYLSDMYADEAIADLRLEGIRKDHKMDAWDVIIGFSRPIRRPERSQISETVQSGFRRIDVTVSAYKTVKIAADNGEVLEMTDAKW
jgi:hypothetical protein